MRLKHRHKLSVLIVVLMAFMSAGTSYGAEYRKDIAVNQQHIAQFIPDATRFLSLHPHDFERCNRFEPQIEAVSEEELPVIDSLLYSAPSLEGMARRFSRVRALAHKQIGCEREEKQFAIQRIALTECVSQVSEITDVDRPMAAPWPVKAVICAASYIDETPYVWGGGHGSFESHGYDCSGAVSYALHGGSFLESPLDSTGLSTWGEPGPGQWITVYGNPGHAWMTVAGISFDTSGTGGSGPRWHSSPVSESEAFVARHPFGY